MAHAHCPRERKDIDDMYLDYEQLLYFWMRKRLTLQTKKSNVVDSKIKYRKASRTRTLERYCPANIVPFVFLVTFKPKQHQDT